MIASIQRRFFSEKFRNFVDLCVQRNCELRPSAGQILQHLYLKKMKLVNVLSTLQMSVMSEGLIEIQKKISSDPRSSSISEPEKSSMSISDQMNDEGHEWTF